MALPSFIQNATGLDDGMANSMAGKLAKLRTAKSKMAEITGGVEDLLSTINGESLPSLPTTNDLANMTGALSSEMGSKIGELDALNDLTGGCLSTALGAIGSISKDAFGMVDSALSAIGNVANMPAEMLGIMNVYAKAQEFANSLGIDELVADITGLLGCESASSMAGDVTGEVAAIMSEMGLSADGKPDPTSYYNKMKSELATAAGNLGLPTDFTDSMADGVSALTESTNALATDAKNAAKAQADAVKAKIKASVPKTPTPPTFF